MMKIHCAESGYWIEIDGLISEAHRYGYSCITKGPSGTLYGTLLEEEPEPGKKAQLYRLTPVDSLTEANLEDGETEFQELLDEDEDEDEDPEDEDTEDDEDTEGESDGEDEVEEEADDSPEKI